MSQLYRQPDLASGSVGNDRRDPRRFGNERALERGLELVLAPLDHLRSAATASTPQAQPLPAFVHLGTACPKIGRAHV